MAVIETMTFRLAEGSAVDGFLAADVELQTSFAYQQPGMVRRTTARGAGDRAGEWIVVDLWETADDADACATRWDHHAVAQRFMSFVDRSTVEVRRYESLG